MISGLAAVIAVASLAMAGWSLVTAVRGGATNAGHLAGVGVVEAVLLVQASIAIVDVIGGARPVSLVTFVGYLAAALLVLPAGFFVSLLERTRWGAAILAAACLVLPVLVLRLSQVWGSGG